MPIPLALMTEISPRTGTAFVLPAGSVLTIVDPLGEQVADFVAFDRADPHEWLSSGRTFDYAETVRTTVGHILYSNRSTPLATIVRDDVGVHDFLLTPCSRDTWRICYGDADDPSPGCFGNLAAALEPFGITGDMIPTTFNVFMNVTIDGDGKITVLPPKSKPGDAWAVRAERDLVVGVTSCSAPASNNGTYKPIHFAIDAKELPC
jgi:uncharacterized protein YcgI (DUF1989 family)